MQFSVFEKFTSFLHQIAREIMLLLVNNVNKKKITETQDRGSFGGMHTLFVICTGVTWKCTHFQPMYFIKHENSLMKLNQGVIWYSYSIHLKLCELFFFSHMKLIYLYQPFFDYNFLLGFHIQDTTYVGFWHSSSLIAWTHIQTKALVPFNFKTSFLCNFYATVN